MYWNVKLGSSFRFADVPLVPRWLIRRYIWNSQIWYELYKTHHQRVYIHLQSKFQSLTWFSITLDLGISSFNMNPCSGEPSGSTCVTLQRRDLTKAAIGTERHLHSSDLCIFFWMCKGQAIIAVSPLLVICQWLQASELFDSKFAKFLYDFMANINKYI